MPKIKSAIKLSLAALALGVSTLSVSAAEVELKEVPREATFISMGNDRGAPVFLDPGLANPYRGGVNSIRWTIMLSVEPLFYYNNLGDEIIPWLGESVEPNDDFTVWTIKLRDGVKWSDGEAFNADDIAFTYKVLSENGAGAGDMRFASNVARTVDSVKIVDPLTVEVTLKKPNPRYPFEHLYAHFANGLIWLPEHVWADVEDPAAFANYDPANGLPVTTGAWQLKEYTENRIVLDRRDDWWGAETGFRNLPDVERIISVPFGNTERGIRMISEGRVDMSPNLQDVIFVRQMLKDNPEITTFSGDESPFGHINWWTISLYPNNSLPEWQDVRVRRALNAAVDPQQIVDFVYEGLNPVNATPFPDFASLSPIREIAKEIAAKHGVGKQDLDRVNALMTEAGYAKNGNGWWAKDGEELKSVIQGIPSVKPFGPFVARQLQDAGFNIEFVSNTDSRTMLRDGTAQMAIDGHRGAVHDPLAGFQLYHCRNQMAPLMSDRWCHEGFSDLVDQMATLSPDDPKMLELGREALEIFYEEAVEVPLMEHVQRFPMLTTNWTNWPSTDNPYIQPGMSPISGTYAYMIHNLEATAGDN